MEAWRWVVVLAFLALALYFLWQHLAPVLQNQLALPLSAADGTGHDANNRARYAYAVVALIVGAHSVLFLVYRLRFFAEVSAK